MRSDELRRLEGFPGSDRPIPYLPLLTIAGIYETVERMNVPVGLYCDGEFLYLLRQQPEDRGVTGWKMVKLLPDFDNGTVEREARFDSRRLHATSLCCRATRPG